MVISSHTSILNKSFTIYEVLDMFKRSGLEGYNYSATVLSWEKSDFYMNPENCIDEAKKIREYADSLGLKACATHSPFPSGFADTSKNAPRFELLKKSIEVASILGAKHTVIHPNQCLLHREHKDELKKWNYDFYTSLIPYADKFGVKICIENMWQWRRNFNQVITNDSVCSTADEFIEYVDMLPRDYFCACVDLGHAPIVGEDPSYMLKSLGDRVEVIHVHDNALAIDDHTLPFLGKMDFADIFKTLKEIDYKGDLTFECDDYLDCFPVELKESAVKLMADVGHYLRKSQNF